MTIQEQLDLLLDTRYMQQKFAIQQEKWFVNNPDNPCPMCTDLERLGWLPIGTLPRYRRAHSELGEGKWKAPDSSCKCTKGYRRQSGDNTPKKGAVLEFVPGFGWTTIEYTFEKVTKDSLIEAKSKVLAILDKYKNCECKH